METVIYILIGIAFFVYQVLKESRKLKEQAKPQEQQMPAPPVPNKPIIHEKIPPRSENRKPLMERRKKTEPVSYEKTVDDLKKKKEKLAKRQLTRFETNQAAEKKRETLEKLGPEVQAKEIKSSLVGADDHLIPYKLQKTTTSRYAELLKNKQSLKDAIVLNEILNKKHF